MGRAASSDGPNKCQAIREYMAENPDARPKAVAEALTEQGVEVTAAFASTVNAMEKKRKTKLNGCIGSQMMPALAEAKSFIDRVGGIDKAFFALKLFRKLSEKHL